MDWWVLELITNVVLVAIAFWLGPLIKRFGRSYAADVFRANPRTGKSFIVLTDIAYYLIFISYIMFTMQFEPADDWSQTVNAAQLQVRGGASCGHPAHHRAPARDQPARIARHRPAAHAEPPARRVDTARADAPGQE